MSYVVINAHWKIGRTGEPTCDGRHDNDGLTAKGRAPFGGMNGSLAKFLMKHVAGKTKCKSIGTGTLTLRHSLDNTYLPT